MLGVSDSGYRDRKASILDVSRVQEELGRQAEDPRDLSGSKAQASSDSECFARIFEGATLRVYQRDSMVLGRVILLWRPPPFCRDDSAVPSSGVSTVPCPILCHSGTFNIQTHYPP